MSKTFYKKYYDFDGYKLARYYTDKFNINKRPIADIVVLRIAICERLGFYEFCLRNSDNLLFIEIETSRYKWMKENNLLDKNDDFLKYCKCMRRTLNHCLSNMDKIVRGE